jgi:hypothetical protein
VETAARQRSFRAIRIKEVSANDNADLEYAKTERIDKQFLITSAPVRDEVVDFIRTAESFNAEFLDVIGRLTNEKIEIFRKKLKKPDLIIGG